MHREADAPGYGADGRVTALALALDCMREQAQPAVPAAAQVGFAIPELMADQGLSLGEEARALPGHRQVENPGIDQDRIGILIEDRLSEYSLILPPQAPATMLEMSFKGLPRAAKKMSNQPAQRRDRQLGVLLLVRDAGIADLIFERGETAVDGELQAGAFLDTAITARKRRQRIARGCVEQPIVIGEPQSQRRIGNPSRIDVGKFEDTVRVDAGCLDCALNVPRCRGQDQRVRYGLHYRTFRHWRSHPAGTSRAGLDRRPDIGKFLLASFSCRP